MTWVGPIEMESNNIEMKWKVAVTVTQTNGGVDKRVKQRERKKERRHKIELNWSECEWVWFLTELRNTKSNPAIMSTPTELFSPILITVLTLSSLIIRYYYYYYCFSCLLPPMQNIRSQLIINKLIISQMTNYNYYFLLTFLLLGQYVCHFLKVNLHVYIYMYVSMNEWMNESA